jgi:Polyketide cyclase / dehydrase and lipid transport
MRTTITAERRMTAPPELIYLCLANYREHHRPDGFLPDAFSDFEIARGGIGAGTEASWTVTTGGRPRHIEATITEPEPGRVLLESAEGLETTFTVDPTPDGALVRFETVIDDPGLQGILTRLFGERLVRPLYEDELTRLEAYARQLALKQQAA